jgi:hypothetical protein
MHKDDYLRTNEPDDDPEITEEESDDTFKEELFCFFKLNILSGDSQKRFEAVEAAGQLEYDPRLTGYFSDLLNDPDADRNLTGISGIGAWKHSDGTEMLINYFTAQNNACRITEAMEETLICSLGSVGGDQALEFLIHYIKDHFRHHNDVDALGMVAVESITRIASRGHEHALRYLIENCRHASWNLRESCAAGLGALYHGKESIPRPAYDILMMLTKDENLNVRIAAYMSLDEIIGLDEKNKTLLIEARHKQISDT